MAAYWNNAKAIGRGEKSVTEGVASAMHENKSKPIPPDLRRNKEWWDSSGHGQRGINTKTTKATVATGIVLGGVAQHFASNTKKHFKWCADLLSSPDTGG